MRVRASACTTRLCNVAIRSRRVDRLDDGESEYDEDSDRGSCGEEQGKYDCTGYREAKPDQSSVCTPRERERRDV